MSQCTLPFGNEFCVHSERNLSRKADRKPHRVYSCRIPVYIKTVSSTKTGDVEDGEQTLERPGALGAGDRIQAWGHPAADAALAPLRTWPEEPSVSFCSQLPLPRPRRAQPQSLAEAREGALWI